MYTLVIEVHGSRLVRSSSYGKTTSKYDPATRPPKWIKSRLGLGHFVVQNTHFEWSKHALQQAPKSTFVPLQSVSWVYSLMKK